MCAIFGFLDYGKKISDRLLTKLLRELSIAAESRGVDATGFSYVKDGKIVTFKKAKPAHKVKLYFPKDTTAVIGHTRFTTQGSEKHNYNNHPFEGQTDGHCFALAHNGVLYNDRKLRSDLQLPDTKIETDSYIAVQLLERQNAVDVDALKYVAETVSGSFVFTVLRNDNTLFLVKGDNPLTIWHFPELGLYVYASTFEILAHAVKTVGISASIEPVAAEDGDIVQISANGEVSVGAFELSVYSFFNPRWYRFADEPEDMEYLDELLLICGCYGVDREDVELLLDIGYTCDEIEEMLLNDTLMQEALTEAKTLFEQ